MNFTNDEGLNKLGAWCLYEAPRRDHKRPEIEQIHWNSANHKRGVKENLLHVRIRTSVVIYQNDHGYADY